MKIVQYKSEISRYGRSVMHFIRHLHYTNLSHLRCRLFYKMVAIQLLDIDIVKDNKTPERMTVLRQ